MLLPGAVRFPMTRRSSLVLRFGCIKMSPLGEQCRIGLVRLQRRLAQGFGYLASRLDRSGAGRAAAQSTSPFYRPHAAPPPSARHRVYEPLDRGEESALTETVSDATAALGLIFAVFFAGLR